VLVEQSELLRRSLMLAVVTGTVTLSVYAHGLTAWPGRAVWHAAHAREDAPIGKSDAVGRDLSHCRTAFADPRSRHDREPFIHSG
jgi:hypothetical protein